MVSINSGSDISRRIGDARAHRPAGGGGGLPGRAAARRGRARSARAVRQPGGRQRRPGPPLRGLRARDPRGRRRRRACSPSTPRTSPRRAAGVAEASRQPGIDAVLTLNNTGGEVARGRSCRASVLLGTFDFSPDGAARRCAPAGSSSRSTSSRTCRATCRSCSSRSGRATGCSRRRARSSPTGPNFITAANAAAGRAPELQGIRWSLRGRERDRNPGDARSPAPDGDLPRGRERPPAARADRRHPARGARPQGDARRGVRLHRRRRRHGRDRARQPRRLRPLADRAADAARRLRARHARSSCSAAGCRRRSCSCPVGVLEMVAPRGRPGGRARRRAPRACR